MQKRTQVRQNPKIIARGAEAVLYKIKNKIVKDRIPKSYRHPQIDNKLRSSRTKSEAKLLEKASKLVPTPKILADPGSGRMIHLEYISGKRLADSLENLKNKKQICIQIGRSLAKLHDAGIIHGDLTTSNLIYKKENNKVYFIDFGLGFHSDRIEDKAVDLHLIKEALQARHPSIFQVAFAQILKGYKSKSKQASKVLKQLEKVEKRGRYKDQY